MGQESERWVGELGREMGEQVGVSGGWTSGGWTSCGKDRWCNMSLTFEQRFKINQIRQLAPHCFSL